MFFKKRKKSIDSKEENKLEEFEKIKSAILPIMRPDYTKTIQEVGKNKHVHKLNKEYFGDIALFYQIDRGDNWEVMIDDNVPKSVTLDEIDIIALSNLYRRYKYEVILSHYFNGYEILSSDESFTSSALILGDIWISLSNRLKDNLIVSLPNRGTVLFVEESKKKNVKDLKKITIEIYKDSCKFQLSKLLYKFDLESKRFDIYE